MTRTIAPIQYKTSYRLAADRIRRAIELGTYLPGERLPPSREFAYQLGISVAALREAVRGLIDEGLLEMRRGPKGGLVVLRRPQVQRRRISKAALAEVDQLIELRKAVEGEAARLAAERRTEKDLAGLQKLIDTMTEEVDGPESELSGARFNRADTEFHTGVARAARNELFVPVIEDTRVRLFASIGVILGPLTHKLNAGHVELIEEIRRQRPDAAADVMRRHIESTREDAYELVKPGA